MKFFFLLLFLFVACNGSNDPSEQVAESEAPSDEKTISNEVKVSYIESKYENAVSYTHLTLPTKA